MATELWQRIKTARKYADLRQQDVAVACGVSRGAVAQWEYEDAVRRTRPNLDQLKALAKAAGVSFDWLINDSSQLDEIWQYTPMAPNKAAPAPTVRESDLVKDIIDELVKARDYDLVRGFHQEMVSNLRPDFLLKNHLVEFKQRFSMEGVAQLLLYERALGRPMEKTLMVRERVPNADSIRDTFGVTVLEISSAWDAADYLHSMLA